MYLLPHCLLCTSTELNKVDLSFSINLSDGIFFCFLPNLPTSNTVMLYLDENLSPTMRSINVHFFNQNCLLMIKQRTFLQCSFQRERFVCLTVWFFIVCLTKSYRIRPYHIECTPSRSIWEVKQCRAALVLGWVTSLEYRVLHVVFCCLNNFAINHQTLFNSVNNKSFQTHFSTEGKY